MNIYQQMEHVTPDDKMVSYQQTRKRMTIERNLGHRDVINNVYAKAGIVHSV
jgi:hypothetical protein